jgi:hypothetical protein
MYDVQCANGHESEQFAWGTDRLRPCACGALVERVFRSAVAIATDDIPGGLTIENLSHQPITFYSHSERRRYMKEHGIREHVRHVGEQGSDKSPHTTRWV